MKIDLKDYADNKLFSSALEVLEILNKEGEAHIVGGFVRDLIMDEI